MSMLEKLTEGIRQRSLAKEGEVITQKWEATGLLEGLDSDASKSNMARLLENQAAQLLKETSTMESGDVGGFAAVAFPIVRRVFGGLLAQDLVSVQPMSLPSGLIFFMDFTLAPQTNALAGAESGDSIYGGGRVASQITGGVDLTAIPTEAAEAVSDKGYRNLNTGYAAASASGQTGNATISLHSPQANTFYNALSDVIKEELKHDADLEAAGGTTYVRVVKLALSELGDLDQGSLPAVHCTTGGTENFIGTADAAQIDSPNNQVRRLTYISGSNLHLVFASATADDLGNGAAISTSFDRALINYPVADRFIAGGGTGGVLGDSTAPGWPLENDAAISEVDIKVDSVAVTAQTKKLKAHWSPELAQDLNAYHNLDAEVELTSVLSEMIAKEIDNEILSDLVNGATGFKAHWSRQPGQFVDIDTGAAVSPAPDFTGTVSEWNETLLDTINSVSANIHRKTLRGGANFVVCGPEVAGILEFTAGFRANVEVDGDSGSWGAMKVGSVSSKMDIFVDPSFPRSVVLVGRRGSSFLESGYVYAPYVPLQMTPTILASDNFTPRKGVMTRYGKKMVRPDMYGLVLCQSLQLT